MFAPLFKSKRTIFPSSGDGLLGLGSQRTPLRSFFSTDRYIGRLSELHDILRSRNGFAILAGKSPLIASEEVLRSRILHNRATVYLTRLC